MATTDTGERWVMDCRRDASGCSVVIAGTKEEILDLAVYHAVQRHQEKDTPEFRRELETHLVPERMPPGSEASDGSTGVEAHPI